MSGQLVAPLEKGLRPRPVELDLELIGEVITAAEDELRLGAIEDRDRCCGYFPALAGMSGIRTELPACGVFAEVLPEISHAGMTYRFDFLRLLLVCQSADPVFHLDSDAATALTGDVGSLNERQVLRLLLNLSSREQRVLHYLDVDPRTTNLVAEGRTSAPRIRRNCRRAPASRLSRHAWARRSTAWRLRQVGCCIPASTVSTGTSSPPTASRLPAVAEPVDAPTEKAGRGLDAREPRYGRACHIGRPAD